MTAEPSVLGREHWTTKGTVRLFLWEKAAVRSAEPEGRSCSCTAPRWPRSRPSTCRCRAGPTPRRWTGSRERGYDTWCVDMEGYGRSDKNRDINCDIANGADDLAAATDYIARTTRRRSRC